MYEVICVTGTGATAQQHPPPCTWRRLFRSRWWAGEVGCWREWDGDAWFYCMHDILFRLMSDWLLKDPLMLPACQDPGSFSSDYHVFSRKTHKVEHNTKYYALLCSWIWNKVMHNTIQSTTLLYTCKNPISNVKNTWKLNRNKMFKGHTQADNALKKKQQRRHTNLLFLMQTIKS